jgi:hypothetical protein
VSETSEGTETRGPRVFLLLSGFVVAAAALIGAFVGANSAERGADVVVFGVATLPTTPAAVALYAAVLAAATLAVLFGAVSLASRLEAPRES